MYFKIYNTFKNANKVEILGTLTHGIRINITTHPYIVNYDNKIYTYQYYVNDKIIKHPYKLYYINNNGEIMHYIVCGKKGFNNHWLDLSIIMGDPDIIFANIIDFYWNKYGYEEYKKEMLKIAANNGHIEAIYELVRLLHPIKDIEIIMNYYEMAVRMGNGRAMCLIADIYNTVKPNLNKRLMYLLMACEFNETNALYALCEYYVNTHNIIGKNLISKYIICHHYDYD